VRTIRQHNDGLLDGLGCMLTSFHNTFIAPNHYLHRSVREREIVEIENVEDYVF